MKRSMMFAAAWLTCVLIVGQSLHLTAIVMSPTSVLDAQYGVAVMVFLGSGWLIGWIPAALMLRRHRDAAVEQRVLVTLVVYAAIVWLAVAGTEWRVLGHAPDWSALTSWLMMLFPSVMGVWIALLRPLNLLVGLLALVPVLGFIATVGRLRRRDKVLVKPMVVALTLLTSLTAAEADEERDLLVAAEDQHCVTDHGCVVVPTDCSSCSCGAAVSQERAASYWQRYQQQCAQYHGPVCDFQCPTPFALCQERRCVLSASDPAVFEVLLPFLIHEAEVIAAVGIRAIDTSSMPADGPMIVDADVIASLKGRGLGNAVRFAASAWVGPTYRPGERRAVFLTRVTVADHPWRNAGWMSVEAGRLEALLIGPVSEAVGEGSLDAFFRGSSMALRLPARGNAASMTGSSRRATGVVRRQEHAGTARGE